MPSSNSTVLDAYLSFRRAVQADKPLTVEQWLTCWEQHYKAHWRTIYEMVLNDYAEQGDDWRQVAREMVFPGMNEKLPAMDSAYETLKTLIEPIEGRVRQALDFDGPIHYVLYTGLGNGAGWVTKYQGEWAVLFGLEGIVDSGFDAPARLEGLIAHELGHVVHFSWRESRALNLGMGPWWQLYEEGFAQSCEGEVLSGGSWHMRSSDPDDDWLDWCQENRAWLAAEFLKTVDSDASVRPFFGSWHQVRGRKQTGYFLGQQVITYLADQMSLRDIALLRSGPELEQRMRHVLRHFVASVT